MSNSFHSQQSNSEESRSAEQALAVEQGEPQAAVEATSVVTFPEAPDVGPSGEEGAACKLLINCSRVRLSITLLYLLKKLNKLICLRCRCAVCWPELNR
jgi:hypothetical protein